MRLISFSLYGSRPMYLRGMVENAKLAQQIYPGWKVRVYCADAVDTRELDALGVKIVRMGISHGSSGMLWRFLPAWEAGVERVIFRDADSRLNIREAAAVAKWMQSDKVAHCMHDHPYHAGAPIMGGMWGIVPGYLPSMMFDWMRFMSGMPRYFEDMTLLKNTVHPILADKLLRHSSVNTPWPSLPFPPHDEYEGFVGQQYGDDMQPIWPGAEGEQHRC